MVTQASSIPWYNKLTNSASNFVVKNGIIDTAKHLAPTLLSSIAYDKLFPSNISEMDSGRRTLYASLIYSTAGNQIYDRVFKTIFFPLFSEHANKAARIVGTATKEVSKIALSIYAAQQSLSYLPNSFSQYDNPLPIAQEGKLTPLAISLMISGAGLVASLIASQILKDSSTTTTPLDTTTASVVKEISIPPPSNRVTQEVFDLRVMQILKECGANMSKTDLINALVGSKGLLQYYDFDIITTRGHTHHLTDGKKDHLVPPLYIYKLNNPSIEDLEDEIREDLSSVRTELPPRLYPKVAV